MKLSYFILTFLILIAALWLSYKRKKRLYELKKKVIGYNKKNQRKFKRRLR